MLVDSNVASKGKEDKVSFEDVAKYKLNVFLRMNVGHNAVQLI